MDALLNTLSYFLWVALALGILVFVHELGHFLAARLFGMRVDAFSLGFPPNLFRKQVGETEYRIGAVPLGGYVKIAGMVDESMDVAYEMEPVLDAAGRPVLDADGETVLQQKLGPNGKPIPTESEPQPDEFRSKPVWQRSVVISAGVVFNFVFACLIYGALAVTSGQLFPPVETGPLDVTPGSIAAEMGLQTGDRVAGVNGEPVEYYEDVFTIEALSTDPFRLTVLRDGEPVELQAEPGLASRLSREAVEVDRAGGDPGLEEVLGVSPRVPPVLAVVSDGFPARDAGLRPGDRILAVNGETISSWNRLTDLIGASDGAPLAIRWARPDSLGPAGDGVTMVEHRGTATVYEAEVTPRPVGDGYQLGIGLDVTAVGQRIERLGLGRSLALGTREASSTVALTFGFIGKLVTGRESVRDNVGGPLMIAKQTKEAADRGGAAFWTFVAYLSIALAVFNVLPVPALDGGHLVFLAYEAVVRREPSLKVRLVVQQVGVALILALMVFVIFNDAVRWFG